MEDRLLSRSLTGCYRYCFADWQVTRMAPAAWDFCTPQAGMEPSQGVKLTTTIKNYYSQ